MRISIQGIALIKAFEGFRSLPYICPAGVATIGFGNTRYEDGRAVAMHDPAISEDRADALLRATLRSYEQGVAAAVTSAINQAQFDALVCFAYNLGIGALKSSTLLWMVNNNPAAPSIRDQFTKWVNGGGKRLEGLAKRRAAEAALYFS